MQTQLQFFPLPAQKTTLTETKHHSFGDCPPDQQLSASCSAESYGEVAQDLGEKEQCQIGAQWMIYTLMNKKMMNIRYTHKFGPE